MKKFSAKRVLSLTLILSLVLALAGCGAPSDNQKDPAVDQTVTPVEDDGKIHLGVTAPFSGFNALMGQNLINGVYLAIDVEGEADRFEVHIEDTKVDPELAVTKLDSLKQKAGCNLIIGSITGNEGEAQAVWAQENTDVLFMTGYSAPQSMTMQYASFNDIRAGWTSDQVTFNFGEYVAKELGYKKVICVGADYSHPWGQAAGFIRGFLENGGEEVNRIWYPMENYEFSSIMVQLQDLAGDYEAVILNDGGSVPVAFYKAWEQYGMNELYPQLLGMTNVAESSILPQMPESFVGVISPSHYVDGADIAANTEFIEAYQASYGEAPDAVAMQGYDSVRLMIRALRENDWNDEDTKALSDSILAMQVDDSPRGSYTFDEYGMAVQNVYIKNVILRDGALTNEIIETYENVSQFGPYDPDKYMSMPADSRDYPYGTRDEYLEDLRQYTGDEYVDGIIENGGW